ncbi:MAG: UDP-N-acetylmuramate--L-alanine ligase [Treponema sp.]|nr:MAG: UDP-N-acetylmuramate--L-alanine ligase [Treponema sp.]
MNRLPANLNGFRIYMIGIKGTGMTALAEILVARGASVSGSDFDEEFYTDAMLKKLGVTVLTPFSVNNLPDSVDLVVFSSAYGPENNVEMAEVLRRNVPKLSYNDALGQLSRASFSCGIAGVHGKTTTTAMVGTILKALNFNSTVLTGSIISSFGDSCTMINGEKYFVAETCEYKRHFLKFTPGIIILTSVESDHEDYYPTYEDILTAFLEYINKLPQFGEVFYCSDNQGACDAVKFIFPSRPDLVLTGYGEKADGNFKIKYKGIKNEKQYFSLAGFAGEFSVSLPGKHNVLNAAAAIALCTTLLKIENNEISINDIGIIRKAISSFKGVKRRSEIIGLVKNILIMDDYAHHPTAIKATLEGLKAFYPNRRIIVDFMSHTYSRTHALLDEFASAFSQAHTVILHKIYSSAREVYTGNITGMTLYEETKKHNRRVHYFENPLDAKSFALKELKSGDLFITMGAGDNWQLGKEIYSELKSGEN